MKQAWIFLMAGAAILNAAEWNQWRGADRNGVVGDKVSLRTVFGEAGPEQLWQSEEIPSDDDGGHGSLVVSGNRIYMGIVWHIDVPSKQREINELTVRRLGFRNISDQALVDKIEKARLDLNPRLRGSKLDEWADQWVKENLDEKLAQSLGGWIKGRFKKGKAAVPYAEMVKVSKKVGTTFEDDAAFKAWIQKEQFSELTASQIIKVVPSSVRQAKDVVVCIDGNTGKTLWRAEAPGEPTGRKSSSTPAVVGGKVFAAGSRHAYCVDAKTGKTLWSTELPGKGTASSFLVHGDKAFIMAGKLIALDVETGKEVWRANELSASNSSPVIWGQGDQARLIVNARSNISCLNPATGEVIWTAQGGGESTPVVFGDWLVAYSRNEKIGLAGYKLSNDGAEMVWNHALEARRTQSSPVIFEGHVYFAGGENQMCIDLPSGKVQWHEKRKCTISSPLIADGKFILLEKNGSDLVMLKASPEAHQELAKTRVKAMWCPSLVVSNGRLFVRKSNGVACFNLASKLVVP